MWGRIILESEELCLFLFQCSNLRERVDWAPVCVPKMRGWETETNERAALAAWSTERVLKLWSHAVLVQDVWKGPRQLVLRNCRVAVRSFWMLLSPYPFACSRPLLPVSLFPTGCPSWLSSPVLCCAEDHTPISSRHKLSANFFPLTSGWLGRISTLSLQSYPPWATWGNMSFTSVFTTFSYFQ